MERKFNRDSIRAIVENPFYAGLVARYPRAPLDMEDDVEYPERVMKPKIQMKTRQILELHQGVHEPIISVNLWQELQAVRRQRGSTPINANHNKRAYMLAGVGCCWECLDEDGYESTLRGSTAGGHSYYRCSYLHDRSLKRKPKDAYRVASQALAETGLTGHAQGSEQALWERHTTLRADHIEPQIESLMRELVIPPEWYDRTMAYYLNDDGLTEFEREGHNLRQSLARYQALFRDGYIDRAEFEAQALHITRQLQALKPTVRPEAQKIAPLLADFPTIWAQMTSAEKRSILKVIFKGLYFDGRGELRKAAAHTPFDQML